MIKSVQQLIGRKKRETIIREFYALGTVIQLRVYGINGERAIHQEYQAKMKLLKILNL